MRVQPPRRRPGNETAGYLGYYVRSRYDHDDEWKTFDLVDGDGSWPVCWYYRKAETRNRRIFEEKPSWQKQELHPSERRILRDLTTWANAGVYVIWEADRLLDERFPLRLTRLAQHEDGDREFSFKQGQWDGWLLDGLDTPPTEGTRLIDPAVLPLRWAELNSWLKSPAIRTGEHWDQLELLLTQLGALLKRNGKAA